MQELRGADFQEISLDRSAYRCTRSPFIREVRSQTLNFLIISLFTAALIVITFIDLDHQIIPDRISIPGIPIGLAASVFFLTTTTWLDSLIGIFAGGGILLFIALAYQVITKKEGMGGGDIKLLAMIGAFTGWQGVIFVVFFSSLIGSVVGIAYIIIFQARRKEPDTFRAISGFWGLCIFYGR